MNEQTVDHETYLNSLIDDFYSKREAVIIANEVRDIVLDIKREKIREIEKQTLKRVNHLIHDTNYSIRDCAISEFTNKFESYDIEVKNGAVSLTAEINFDLPDHLKNEYTRGSQLQKLVSKASRDYLRTIEEYSKLKEVDMNSPHTEIDVFSCVWRTFDSAMHKGIKKALETHNLFYCELTTGNKHQIVDAKKQSMGMGEYSVLIGTLNESCELKYTDINDTKFHDELGARTHEIRAYPKRINYECT